MADATLEIPIEIKHRSDKALFGAAKFGDCACCAESQDVFHIIIHRECSSYSNVIILCRKHLKQLNNAITDKLQLQ